MLVLSVPSGLEFQTVRHRGKERMDVRAGKRRNIFAVWLGRPIITLGIYTYVWHYKVNREARHMAGPSSAAKSVRAVRFGCILLYSPPFVSSYRTGGPVSALRRRAGLQRTCSGGLGILLIFGFGPWSLYFQS